jgi:hypothetical protein
MEGGSLLVNCGTAEIQEFVLSLDGGVMGAGVLNISRHRRILTGDEIFHFVRELLKIEEEVAMNRRAYGGQYPVGGGPAWGLWGHPGGQLRSSLAFQFAGRQPRAGAGAGAGAAGVERGPQRRPACLGRPGEARLAGQGARQGWQGPQPACRPNHTNSTKRRKGGRGGGGAWSAPITGGSAVPGRGKGGFNSWNYWQDNSARPQAQVQPQPQAQRGAVQFIPSAPRPFVFGECFACKCAGKDFKHDFRSCAFDAQMKNRSAPQNNTNATSSNTTPPLNQQCPCARVGGPGPSGSGLGET